MRSSSKCIKCTWYNEDNRTCQLKKCSTGGYGYVTIYDGLYCTKFIKKKAFGRIEKNGKKSNYT